MKEMRDEGTEEKKRIGFLSIKTRFCKITFDFFPRPVLMQMDQFSLFYSFLQNFFFLIFHKKKQRISKFTKNFKAKDMIGTG